MTSSPAAIAEKLIEARKTRTPQSEFPGTLPDTPEGAYHIQDLCIKGWDDKIVGWKVAGLKAELHEQFKAKRQSGPVFEKNLRFVDCSEHILAPVYAGGFAAIEAEFVILLGNVSHLPTSDLSADDVRSVIEKVFIGIEIASSPMKDTPKYGTFSGVSDFGNNAGIIVGPEVKNWQDVDLSSINVSVEIGGDVVGSATAKPELDGPLGALTYLIEHLAQRNHDLPAGSYVSSGAITGAHRAELNVASKVSFEGYGAFSLELVSNA